MEDGESLNTEEKIKMNNLKKELLALKAEHKSYAKNKVTLSAEEKDKWRINSQRTNQVYIEIKELRFKNILNAGRGSL